MSKFKFTKGQMKAISEEYYNLTLFNGEKVVYKATLNRFDAAKMINKYNNITLVK